METAGLRFQPVCLGQDCDRGHSSVAYQASLMVATVVSVLTPSLIRPLGQSACTVIHSAIPLVSHLVKSRKADVTLSQPRTRFVEMLWADKGKKWQSVFDYLAFSYFPGVMLLLRQAWHGLCRTWRDLWLDPDVWTASQSQGSSAIYPEDIKWPNGCIICTEVTWRNLL